MNPFDSDNEGNTEAYEAALLERLTGNKQLYGNSPLSGSSVESDWQEDPARLFGAKPPNLAILHESPRHRLAVFLKMQGLSNREIALRLGFTEPWVSQILRQPWAQQRLVHEITEAGRDVVTELLRGAAADSVFTLIEVRDSQEATSQSRVNASNSILDRLYGKPTQRVESFGKDTSRIPLEDLDKELARLEAEEARLTGRRHDQPAPSGQGRPDLCSLILPNSQP